ncbi:MAG: sodium-dependent transporter [Sphaerochaetaceae bacterium]|jgi:NSS family neurotransmitter:Na+ symporter|nr:sodium-dependent transporter [Sphaerochaetaceae bacterium]MDD4219057.1 sodium-dependent transporter [Sphaerochaetaceae bacterium]MDY0371458.1 sodium-dependent transporter [Sphaerochaetaceae bacterium]
MPQERELLKSRIGFIFLSAGCAIGLGNVWRFPFITGKHGGAAFVLLYILFLLIFGLPIMVMEFAVGRAAKQNVGLAFKTLQPKGTSWHRYGPIAIGGNYVLMMFYTTVSGWLLAYLFGMAKGSLTGLSPEAVGNHFGSMLSNPVSMTIWMVIATLLGLGVCAIGLQKGVEKITKYMMSALLAIMLVLVIKSITLPGAGEGLKFYLLPNFPRLKESGIWNAIYAAMGQAFFTLSLGIGSMAIFGSYIGKENTLTGESINVVALDTFVALMSGLIIFPAAFAFNVNPDAGPSLIFITLPNIFNAMQGGRLWGTLFFVFMGFAALSTLVAVFENIVSYWIDVHKWTRKKAVLVNIVAIILLSLPCVLGFNVLSNFNPLGGDSVILDLEDFIVSSVLLPLGSLVFLLFCCTKRGWGWDAFIAEADTGKGVKFPKWARTYVTYVLPILVLFVFVMGIWDKFAPLILGK